MLKVLNQLPELIAFVESVNNNTFTAAAQLLGTTPSAISKRVAKLEDRLRVRLLQRTTRSFSLTTEGKAYYERVSRLLQELKEANDLVISGGKPHGKITISTSLDFGQWLLVQSIPEFLARYPEIQIDLRLSDHFVNLVAERIDIAIRLGDLKDSSLIRRYLGQTQFVLCASPTYLKAHGIPTTPEDLVKHNCLRYIHNGRPVSWEFLIGEEWQTIPVTGTFDSDNGGALKNAAVAGLGITRLLSFQVDEDIRKKRLRLLFPDQVLPGPVVQAVFTHPVSQLPPLHEQNQWVGLTTVVMVVRSIQHWNKTTHEVQFYITSLATDANKIGSAIRQHWGIENSLHWTLDVTFHEDESRIRSLHSPQNFALLRRIALNTLGREPTFHPSIRQKSRRAAMNDQYMVSVLAASLPNYSPLL